MNTQQQAYINGFVKRAAQHGVAQHEALTLLKSSAFEGGFGLNASAKPVGEPGDQWKGTGFHGSRAFNAIYGDPSAAKASTPAASPSASGPSVPETQGSSSGAGAPSISTAPAAPQAAPAQQGPSNAFLSKVIGSYNPNSKVDQAQAARIKEMYQPGMTAKQIYADPRYKINREALGAPKGSNQSGYRGI